MTPNEMARIYALAFAHDRPWHPAEFSDLLANPYAMAHEVPHGFAITRTVARESELITIAVDPAHHGSGLGRKLMIQWLEHAEKHADFAFLEVAADNSTATKLYTTSGFEITGTRRAYYTRQDGPAVDALLLTRAFTHGQAPDNPPS
ncbi:ribosomal-protein-alanine acetyltransferase [Sulfitobacter sp. SK012]|uniref:GNAT family N-acetyltransferase n=1 Tax=Sulfitobacter sp. SK012 TaxID=1389005 RepID=UPI000E0A21B6|nr:GNAT family N-acetyltransferase [Sulfitobacter sp. SK012]AXI47736.1 ribosomal-protein-alanine acetyltransferase [Sulfitobacter sp. SK012]